MATELGSALLTLLRTMAPAAGVAAVSPGGWIGCVSPTAEGEGMFLSPASAGWPELIVGVVTAAELEMGPVCFGGCLLQAARSRARTAAVTTAAGVAAR